MDHTQMRTVFGVILFTVVFIFVFYLAGENNLHPIYQMVHHQFEPPLYNSRVFSSLITFAGSEYDFCDGIGNHTRKWETPEDISSPQFSEVVLVNPKEVYHVGDLIEILITIRDGRGKVKQFGGDYLRAKILSKKRAASSRPDYIQDFCNGTFRAGFVLPFEADDVMISVMIVHPREAIDLLEDANIRAPERFWYEGMFKNQVGFCSATFPNKKGTICNLSDPIAYAPWFCVKPRAENISCSDWSWHRGRNTFPFKTMFPKEEIRPLLWRKLFIKGPKNSINVQNGTLAIDERSMVSCNGVPPSPSDIHRSFGYFLNDTWHPKKCRLKHFTEASAMKCLANKTIYFHGDSTIRQFFEYFHQHFESVVLEQLFYKEVIKVGPMTANNKENNVTLHYRHHGLPIRNSWTKATDIKNKANEMDSNAGPDDIFVITVWAHYTPYAPHMYRRRLIDIRKAVDRLNKRSPDAIVIIKGANTRYYPTGEGSYVSSDWYALRIERALREIFMGARNVRYIDSWDITDTHRSPDAVHPNGDIIKNYINTMLTYICP